MRARATIVEVARAAQVSRQTVSNVVNAPERVAPATLERVNREIERLGFRPSRAARTLKQERAGAWGIELNASGIGKLGSVLDAFLVQLTTGSRRHDSHLVPFTAPDPSAPLAAYEDLLASRIADGFVLTDTRFDDPRPQWLLDQHVPFASFGRIWDDPDITTWVDVDGAAGCRDAVNHLAQAGYERIGWLGWPDGSAIGDERHRGWAEAIDTHGYADQWQGQSPQALASAVRAAADLVDGIGRGGALVCASDVLALAAWEVVIARGWQIGVDFGIVGFDDTEVASSLGLTTLRQPLETIAEEVLSLLGNPAMSTQREGLLLAPELVIRASSSPAGDRTTERGTT